jgi:hypothetical protein
LGVLRRQIARRHYLWGWCLLFVFLGLGGVLETLHGFKIGIYLDPDRRIRRELWRLAHAHGTLLALVQLAFAAGVTRLGRWTPGRLKLVSFFLLDAAGLMPVGFFLGGFGHGESDPGPGILLVPFGAALLAVAAGMTAWSARRT